MTANDLDQRTREWKEQLHPFEKYQRRERLPFLNKGTALLVIDMQAYFLDPSSHAYFHEAGEIVENVIKLVQSFRSSRLPIIFTRHALTTDEDGGIMLRWWGDLPIDGEPLSTVDSRLDPQEGEKVVRKTRYSAFIGTDLDDILQKKGVERVVITGVMTHLCCETTARDAFMRDLEVWFVMDATATDTEVLHLGSLRALADGFALLATTGEVLRWMREGR